MRLTWRKSGDARLLLLAAGALVSNWFARRLLRGMGETRFRTIVIGFMAPSGVVMLWQQREIPLAQP